MPPPNLRISFITYYSDIHILLSVLGSNSWNAWFTALSILSSSNDIFLCVNDWMLMKRPRSSMFQLGLFGGCWIRMKVNPSCSWINCNFWSSWVIYAFALSCSMKMVFWPPSHGYFSFVAGIIWLMSMFLVTLWLSWSPYPCSLTFYLLPLGMWMRTFQSSHQMCIPLLSCTLVLLHMLWTSPLE